MGTKEWTSQEVAQSFPPLQGLSSFSSKDKDAITLFSLLSSSGMQSSSNTPHITSSEFSLKVIFS